MDTTMIIALAATTGYVVACTALVRESRRRVAAEWARLRQAQYTADYQRGLVDADELRAEVSTEPEPDGWCQCVDYPLTLPGVAHLKSQHPKEDT